MIMKLLLALHVQFHLSTDSNFESVSVGNFLYHFHLVLLSTRFSISQSSFFRFQSSFLWMLCSSSATSVARVLANFVHFSTFNAALLLLECSVAIHKGKLIIVSIEHIIEGIFSIVRAVVDESSALLVRIRNDFMNHFWSLLSHNLLVLSWDIFFSFTSTTFYQDMHFFYDKKMRLKISLVCWWW